MRKAANTLVFTALALALVLTACEGPMGLPGEQGEPGMAGAMIVWKGELPAAPEGAQLYWAYYNTTTGNAYIYNGASWELLARTGANGANGVDGADGVSIIWNGYAWMILARDGQVGPQCPVGRDGASILWKGASAQAPANPQVN